jgi:FMN phosphatase YigB (HAD superfamily)
MSPPAGFIHGDQIMSLTVLIDLDDTLLKNDMDRFLKNYLGALSKRVNHLPAEQMINALLAATRKMLSNNNPGSTLEECFDQHFYPAIHRSKESQNEAITSFYRDDFPSIRRITENMPDAAELVMYIRKNNHQLVLATNPLFPRTAILQRLEWAGLSPHDFNLITDYQSFHFAKPNPAFYAEILAHLGCPDSTAVMIGNDLLDDMIPASALGFPVFWITNSQEPFPENFHPLSSRGSLSDVIAWLETVSQRSNDNGFLKSTAAYSPQLQATPAGVDFFLRSLDKGLWNHRQSQHEWALVELISHLNDSEIEVNLPSLVKVLAEDNAFLPGVDTDRWVDQREYIHKAADSVLSSFCNARMDFVSRISALPDGDWQRTARHAIFGRTHLAELVGFMISHDRTHLQQAHSLVLKTAR